MGLTMKEEEEQWRQKDLASVSIVKIMDEYTDDIKSYCYNIADTMMAYHLCKEHKDDRACQRYDIALDKKHEQRKAIRLSAGGKDVGEKIELEFKRIG